MPGNYKKEDLRIKKTYKNLINAMLVMLNKRNFCEITVNDLCEEALISRATFYVYFDDKYDLLKYWLKILRKEIIIDLHVYEETEKTVNKFVSDHQKIITNIIKNANSEVIALVYNFMTSIIELSIRRQATDDDNVNYSTLVCFCVGGLVNRLMWQVRNKFPEDNKMLNRYLYDMIKSIIEWDASQE